MQWIVEMLTVKIRDSSIMIPLYISEMKQYFLAEGNSSFVLKMFITFQLPKKIGYEAAWVEPQLVVGILIVHYFA